MKQISETTRRLLTRLYELQATRRWYRRSGPTDHIIAVLGQIIDQDEPAAIPSVVRCLFHHSAEVRASANLGLQRLLPRVPPEELLHLSDAILWSWDGYISDAWEKLSPEKIESLIVHDGARSSILGIASLHHNGYVRHEAVRLLADIRDGSELPYLLIRQNDWVTPISADARAAIEGRLVEDYLPHFFRSLPLVVHLTEFSRYNHSDTVNRFIKLLVQPQQDSMLASAIASPNRFIRRRVLKLALDLGGEHQRRIVEHGLNSNDAVLRLWCTRLTSSCFSGEVLFRVLATLKQDRFMPIRREAFIVNEQICVASATDTWKPALLDDHASIRELARIRLTKSGEMDAASFYRQTLAKDSNVLAALNGLGETGEESDLPLIRSFLKAPLSSRRRAAVRGLSNIGGDAVVDELTDYLRDDSLSVVREVRKRLQDGLRVVDVQRLFAVVAEDTRQQVRAIALRLIFETGKWRSLPWLIRSSANENEKTAWLAQEYIESWFTPPRCNSVFTKPSSSVRQAIDEALSDSRESLEEQFGAKLQGWLDQS